MRTHEITIEAGRFHFLSNRISKAIIAQKEGKTASASIAKIDELKAGDILLLCSDGVVEGWGDWELVQLFSDDSLSFEQKCEKIAQQCNEKSKDNNTAIIAEIEAQDAFSFGTNEELDWTTFAEVEADYQAYLKENSEVDVDGAYVVTEEGDTFSLNNMETTMDGAVLSEEWDDVDPEENFDTEIGWEDNSLDMDNSLDLGNC